MSFLALLISTFGALLLIISSLAFFKAKDVFTMTHVIMISNLYIIPLILIGVEIERFSATSLVKIIVIIVLNLALVNLLCHTILRRAMINKISPDAKIKN